MTSEMMPDGDETVMILELYLRRRLDEAASSSSSSGIDTTTIIVIAAGAALGVVVVILGVYCYRRSSTEYGDQKSLMARKHESSSSNVSAAEYYRRQNQPMKKKEQRDRERQGRQHQQSYSSERHPHMSGSARKQVVEGKSDIPLTIKIGGGGGATMESSGGLMHPSELVKNSSDISNLTGTPPHNNGSNLVDLDNFNSDDDEGGFDNDNFFAFDTNKSSGVSRQKSTRAPDTHAWPPPATLMQQTSQRKYPDPEEVYPITSFDSEVDAVFTASFPPAASTGPPANLGAHRRVPSNSTPSAPRVPSPPSSIHQGSPNTSVGRKSPSQISLVDSESEEEEIEADEQPQSPLDNSNSNSRRQHAQDDMQAAMNAAVFAAAAGGNAGALKAAREIQYQKARASPTQSVRSSNSAGGRSHRANARSFKGNSDDEDSVDAPRMNNSSKHSKDNPWLYEAVKDTLGPRHTAADMESLGGRSKGANSVGNKSMRSNKSFSSAAANRTKRRSSRKSTTNKRSSNSSVGSNNSRRSHRSHKSALSAMSDASRSIAADLMRLETQLALVGGATTTDATSVHSRLSNASVGSINNNSNHQQSSTTSLGSTSHHYQNRVKATKRDKMNVVVPPGKLGVILANKEPYGTIVSDVRTTSVLYGKIFPGDRIVSVDNEDVSRMTVAEITALMARKAAYDRVLTIITSLKLNNMR